MKKKHLRTLCKFIRSKGDNIAFVLQTPGELFVEYQLAALAMRPDEMVYLAACGGSGAVYVGTKNAYAQQGGYETNYSRVGPEMEDVLINAFRELLE